MNKAYNDTNAVIISREGAVRDIDAGKATDTLQLSENRNGIFCLYYRSEFVIDRSTINLAKHQKRAQRSN